MQFGFWTVVAPDTKKWLCRCVCGVERRVNRDNLKRGYSTNCGCIARKNSAAASSAANKKHGMDGTPTYTSWVEMRRRCRALHRKEAQDYALRGIYVCDEWASSFAAFLRDMGERPPNTTLDRIDNNGPYSKANCRWAPASAQARNRRTNRLVVVNGQEMTVAEAAVLLGVTRPTILRRYG